MDCLELPAAIAHQLHEGLAIVDIDVVSELACAWAVVVAAWIVVDIAHVGFHGECAVIACLAQIGHDCADIACAAACEGEFRGGT